MCSLFIRKGLSQPARKCSADLSVAIARRLPAMLCVRKKILSRSPAIKWQWTAERVMQKTFEGPIVAWRTP